MPYINKDRRPYVQPTTVEVAQTGGELNYQVSQLVNAYLKEHGQSYQTFSDIHGALTLCDVEVYRRLVGPYEDQAIGRNGDAF